MTDLTNDSDQLLKQGKLDPETLMRDQEVMQALADACEHSLGDNVIDIRGITIDRLRTKLEKLEIDHSQALELACYNMARANQMQRAMLALLKAKSREEFMGAVDEEVPGIIKVEKMAIVFEWTEESPASVRSKCKPHPETVIFLEPSEFESCIKVGVRAAPIKSAFLRQRKSAPAEVYGDHAKSIKSEALTPINLAFDDGKIRGVLFFGSASKEQFDPKLAKDLLNFFGGVFEKALYNWLKR